MSSVVGALLLVARNETGMGMSGLVYLAMYIRVMMIDRYSLLSPNLFAFGCEMWLLLGWLEISSVCLIQAF
jgi:hypothetical protein